jgi:hypothetical protein
MTRSALRQAIAHRKGTGDVLLGDLVAVLAQREKDVEIQIAERVLGLPKRHQVDV